LVSRKGEKMLGGYVGKLLFVDLSTGDLKEEVPDEKLYKDFVGGSGLGARIIYSRQKSGVDPLGPENILGFVTGPLTGTPAVTGTRYQAVGKSPLTGGWGDANSGGYFGPYLKFAGYDAVFFTGISDKPVYLFIDNGKAELKNANHLWGKDTYATEDMLADELSKDVHTICIGPSGENLSLISCIITTRGSAAGRSGLGAVMGSKKLKAITVRGNMDVPLADKEMANKLRREHVQDLRIFKRRGMEFLKFHHTYGTADQADIAAHNGDAPVKNWGGIGIIDMPDVSGLSLEKAQANVDKRYGCWHCPLACQASLKEGTAPYEYPAGTRRPEYETQEAFGSMCCNTDSESIAMVNHLCNSYGVDTISAGGIIAFAIECYENGIITKKDTDGIELTWGNSPAIVAMTEKLVKREGLGDILADGVKVAAEKIGNSAVEYAVHVGGQEPGMHDPKFARPAFSAAARYQMDATPGRHTAQAGRMNCRRQLLNSLGLCSYCDWPVPDANKYFQAYMKAVTGWDRSIDELIKCGERIVNIRHAFNLREGINFLTWKLHPRMIGVPPQKEGPLVGVTADIDAQLYWNLGVLDWDRITTKPSLRKLTELGLDDVANDLWPPDQRMPF
jgi:aldehyde:ferredoxin oxidoreductase